MYLEFQVVDEADMLYRIIEYRALLSRKYKLPVHQYLIFLSDQQPQMATALQGFRLSFTFELVWLAQVDYTLFLASTKPDEVVFALLGYFGTDDAQNAAKRIVERLVETSSSQLNLGKYLEQLRVLANLRKLKPFIEQIMGSITKYFNPEDDLFYKKGKQEGIQRGKAEVKMEFIRKSLKEGILTTKQIMSFFEISEEEIDQLQKEMNL